MKFRLAIALAALCVPSAHAQTPYNSIVVGTSASRSSTYMRIDTVNPAAGTHAQQTPFSVMAAGNILASDLAPSGATTGQALVFNGFAWAPATLSGSSGPGGCTAPGLSTLGCVFSSTAGAHKFATGLDTLGNLVYQNMNANDINGSFTPAQVSAGGGELTTNKGAVNGYAGLDGSGHVPASQLPAASVGPTDTAAIHYRGAWTASTSYALNDAVSYNSILYVAPVAFTSSGTFSASNWTQLTYNGSGPGYTSPSQCQIYNSPGTYTWMVPTNALLVRGRIEGGGASGAPGTLLASGTAGSGGAGGSAGGVTPVPERPASAFTGSYTIVIPPIAPATTSGASVGNAGGTVTFVGTGFNLQATGAAASSGGSSGVAAASGTTGSANLAGVAATGATAGSCAAAAIGCVNGSNASGDYSGNAALYVPALPSVGGGSNALGSGFVGGNAVDGPTGGGAGQGSNAGGTAGAGARGGSTAILSGGAAGSSGGGNGGNGISPTDSLAGTGGGGGGNGSSGGNGGTAGTGAGGGGGGNGQPGGVAGNGGAGGSGAVEMCVSG